MKKIIFINIRFSKDLLSIGANEQFANKPKTVEYYEEIPFSEENINNTCLELFNHFDNVCRKTLIHNGIIEQIKSIGQILFDQLFTPRIKNLIVSTKSQDIIFKIDGSLVHIPWELLYDGTNFLCERFSMGRMVSTLQPPIQVITRTPQKPFKMLILADSRGNLTSAYKEGELLREKFRDLNDEVKIDLKTSFIKKEFIERTLRNYDIVHYAGHANYDLEAPSRSGWKTADEPFTVSDITKMRGGAPFPILVFSNACQSGKTEPWDLTADTERAVYGLANAFLLSGVQHYIGTFWNIPDRPGPYLAETFYQNLFRGMSIGQSLREARLHLIQKYGDQNITWMAYMLYGDPTIAYFDKNNFQKPTKKPRPLEKESEDEIIRNGKSITPKQHRYPFKGSFRSPLNKILSLLFLLLILAGTALIFKHRMIKPTPPIIDQQDDISLLIKQTEDKLEERQEEEGLDALPNPDDEWTARPITLFVSSYISENNQPVFNNMKLRQRNDKLALEIASAIQNQRSMLLLVNRDHLKIILEEIMLSSSDLVDKKADLTRAGKLLGARFILLSEIRPFKKRYKIYIEMLETETSNIQDIFKYPQDSSGISVRSDEQLEKAAVHIADMILSRLKPPRLLKGKIIALIESNQIQINIGSRVGVSPGLVMTILDAIDESTQIGEIEILTVKQYSSLARVLNTNRSLKPEDKVIAKR